MGAQPSEVLTVEIHVSPEPVGHGTSTEHDQLAIVAETGYIYGSVAPWRERGREGGREGEREGKKEEIRFWLI